MPDEEVEGSTYCFQIRPMLTASWPPVIRVYGTRLSGSKGVFSVYNGKKQVASLTNVGAWWIE